MKKFLCFIILLSMPVFAIRTISEDEQNNFMKSLKLSKRQTKNIEKIEQDYRKKAVEINTNILLKETQLAQLKFKKDCTKEKNQLQREIQVMKKDGYNLCEERQKKIIKALNFFQKRKYKEFISRVY